MSKRGRESKRGRNSVVNCVGKRRFPQIVDQHEHVLSGILSASNAPLITMDVIIGETRRDLKAYREGERGRKRERETVVTRA